MKNFTMVLSILCLFASLAFAGPEQYSGKEMKQIAAPMPPACPSWTGFYIGGFGGYKFGVIDSELNLGGDWDMFSRTVSALESRGSFGLDTSGAELGGLFGYNYQWNNWVVGMEAAGGYLWLRNSETTGKFSAPAGNYVIANSFETHYLLTVGPRLGYAVCRWLPYVTGGLAVGDLDFSQRFYSSDFFGHLHEHANDTNAGWFLGGGLEYALTNHWRVRAQYQYIDLGDVGFTYDTSNNDFVTQGKASPREHNASFALIYGF